MRGGGHESRDDWRRIQCEPGSVGRSRSFTGLVVGGSVATAGMVAAQSPAASAGAVDGTGLTIGVSWANFQEERWKADEAAIKGALEALGATYVSTDAQSSATKQQSDIESLITDGVDALIIVPWDVEAIKTAIDSASAEGIPTIAYDRQFEDARSFYMSFDNVEVGRMLARAIVKAQPQGIYAVIKGNRATRTRSSCARASVRSSTRPSRQATSPSATAARSTRTAGSPRTPRRTWSRS